MRKPCVLVIHNHYRQAGGEDTVVRAEVALLRQHGHQVVEYVRDNASIEGFGSVRKASLMLSATWNARVYSELRQLIRAQRPTVAHCHNLVPLISPAAYYACHAEGVPVVQTRTISGCAVRRERYSITMRPARIVTVDWDARWRGDAIEIRRHKPLLWP